jgi:hypothetical protein
VKNDYNNIHGSNINFFKNKDLNDKCRLTLIVTTVSTDPRDKLAPRGSKFTLKTTVSWSGAPGRFLTLFSSTWKP